MILLSLLARHDAIASGTPFPIQWASSNTVPNEAQCRLGQSNISSSSPAKSSSSPKATYPGIVFSDTRSQSDDEEDEFVHSYFGGQLELITCSIFWGSVIEARFSSVFLVYNFV